MRLQKRPQKLAVGDVFILVCPYSKEDGKPGIKYARYEVRSIRRKRGSVPRSGSTAAPQFVNLCMVESYTKDTKTGRWKNNIPDWCLMQFPLTDEFLPFGLATTKERALRLAVYEQKDELKELKSLIKERPQGERLQVLNDEKAECEIHLLHMQSQLKRLVTRRKNDA